MQNHNFTCFVWTWNFLSSHLALWEEHRLRVCCREYLDVKGRSNGRLEKIVRLGASWFVLFTKHYCEREIKYVELGRTCDIMGEKRNAYRIFAEIPEGRRPVGWPMHTWKHNIKIDLKEIGWEDVEWIYPTEIRHEWQAVVNMVTNLEVL
jgi:hypothetical protein